MGSDPWGTDTVGNSLSIDANQMSMIGCAVTGTANAVNTLNGSNITPKQINDNKNLFPNTTDDDKNSDVDMGGFAQARD